MHQLIEDFRDGWRIESWKARATSLLCVVVAIGSLTLAGFCSSRYGIANAITLKYFAVFLIISIVVALCFLNTALTGARIREQFTRHT